MERTLLEFSKAATLLGLLKLFCEEKENVSSGGDEKREKEREDGRTDVVAEVGDVDHVGVLVGLKDHIAGVEDDGDGEVLETAVEGGVAVGDGVLREFVGKVKGTGLH